MYCNCCLSSKYCEAVPYPVGTRWICTFCGDDYYDLEAAMYRDEKRKELHALLDQLPELERKGEQ